MDDDLYDEFGNLIGDPQDSDAESVDYVFEREDSDTEVQDAGQQLIVHHQEKQLYPTMSETFGEDVETVVQFHDNQSIAEPLVKPTVQKFFKIEDKKLPKTTYSKEYLLQLLDIPSRVRNVSLVGSLNSGKTSFLDMLILETHLLKVSKNAKNYKRLRYTDNTKLEIERGVTIKSSPMTLLLQNLKDNSMAFNIIDTPGHVDFSDELAVAQRLADISLVVLDVVEGLTIGAKRAIDNALINNIQLGFVINKIDRLILELKLPPTDAFHKIRNVVDEVNTYLTESQYWTAYEHKQTISPDLNNIFFASAEFSFCFNLRSFAQLYAERQGLEFDIDAFAKRLWGDVYYDETRNKFTKRGEKRSFVHFVLEPIYKIVTQVLSQPAQELKKSMYNAFGISLSKDLLKSDPQVQLKEIFSLVFGKSTGFVDVLETFTSPDKHSKTELYTGSKEIKEIITRADSEGPVVAHISKMVEFNLAMARPFSGKIKKGQEIKILGENYNDDDEDIQVLTVSELYIPGGRYKIPVEEVPTGCIFLLGGVEIISKTGTIFGSTVPEPLNIFTPVDYLSKSVFKVVIEPHVPSERPKLLDGLRKINKSYCGAEIKVEESGEHVILGAGELYMDSLMFDLRHITDIHIKISDPITKFSETVVDASFTKLTTKSQNEENSITIIAEPLEEKLAHDLEKGTLRRTQKRLNKILREQYGWDSLAARSLWSFGPDINAPNALLDDTLSEEVDKETLNSMKDLIIRGFQLAVCNGPLADEPIRGVKFKIIDAKFSKDVNKRGGGQIMPMVRRACYCAMLTSSPKLMEPVYALEIVSTAKTIRTIEDILDKRRGTVLKDAPIPATQLYKIHGFVPVIDSAGLETDIRVMTEGQALVSLYFDKWSVVPGDPLDKDVFIPKLRPAPINGLARDFVMKTRKRKGLGGEPTLAKHIDKDLVEQLKELGML